MRRAALLAPVLLLATACGGAPEQEPARADAAARKTSTGRGRPSVLLVSLDTTRADRLGCYGADGASTPTLDRWASEGALFENAATPVPVTLPAHASLLTGLLPHRHGVRDNGLYRLPDDVETLAGHLRDAGYHTAAVLGAAVLDRQYGLARGFDVYDDRVGRGGGLTAAERDAAAVTRAALEAVAGADGPFFLLVHYFDPHADYRPPPPFDRLFEGRAYDGEIAFVDRELGRLREGLEEAGRMDDTLVVVTADHGEGLGEHGEATHGVFLYQSTLRVPLIFRWPGRIEAGLRIEAPVRLTDVAPTLLDMLGLEVPGGLDGSSLAPELGGETGMARPLPLESEFGYNAYGWSPLRGLIEGRRKWISAPEPELYDLERDPGETENLASARAEEAAALARTLRASLAEDRRAWPPAGESMEEESDRLARLAGLGYTPAPGRGAAGGRSLPDPKRVIGTLSLVNHAREALGAGRPLEAERVLRGVLAEAPENLSALILLGSTLIQSGRPGDAVEPLARAADLSPLHAEVRFNLGIARLGSGDAAGAEEAWRAALALSPRFHDAAANLVDLLLGTGRSGEAAALLEQTRREGVEGPVLDFLEARLALGLGDRSRARRALERAAAGDLPPHLAAEARRLLGALGSSR